MKRDFTIDDLALCLAEGFGVVVASVEPLAGHAHSLNFKVTTTDGLVFAAKCFPSAKEGMFARLLAHSAELRLFDGKTLSFGCWRVIALRWIAGTRRFPDELTPAELDAFLAAHAAFIASRVDDGEVMPLRDGLVVKRELLARLKGGNAPGLVREIRLMADADLTLDESKRRIIHGDLHWENFRFLDGAVSGFLDLEELRFGTPAEDLIRYVVCRAEHQRWHDIGGRRRLLKVFDQLLAKTPYTRNEWLFAINGYLLRKLDKKIKAKKVPLALRLNLAARLPFYRALRERVMKRFPRERSDDRIVVKIFGGTVARFMGEKTFDWNERFRFTCDPGAQDYDWLCVYDELPANYPGVARGKLRVRCPRERTMLLTQEPVSLKFYNKAYTHQFGLYLTNRPKEAENHPGYRKGAGYMVWYTGRSFAAERARVIGEKAKGLSAVYSAKRMTHTKHGARFDFLTRLKKEVPGFDWYGKGVRPIAEKFEVLDDYKYHLAFENHVGAGHWTEKLSDALVAGCLPFYAGDPAITAVLPKEAFIAIPADDPDAALRIIREAMSAGEYEKRRGAIAEARKLLFTRYNLFAQIAAAIESAPEAARAKGACTLVTRHRARLNPVALVGDLAHHIRQIFHRA